MQEVWRKIPGFPWYYEVSDLGRIRSLARTDKRGWKIKTRILRPRNAQLNLQRNDGTTRWCALAALILRAFKGEPPIGKYLSRHLDDDRSNNKLSNLAWGDDQDNHDDAKRNGISFVSYGHLGKPHSEATKALLSSQRKGIPTGRKMTDSHRAAIWAGYRNRFPKKPKPIATKCACGCGEYASPGKSFIHGHAGRIKFRILAKERIGRPRPW